MRTEVRSNNINKEIVKILSDNKGHLFGEIVKELDYPYQLILDNIIELRKSGVIHKDENGYSYYYTETMENY